MKRSLFRSTLGAATISCFVALAFVSVVEASEKKDPSGASKTTDKKVVARKIAEQSPQGDSPEMKAFVGFVGCRDKIQSSKGTDWLKCMDPFVVKAQFRKDAFARFLITTEVVRARECTTRDFDGANGFPGMTKHAVCFEYVENAETRLGMAFFVIMKGEPKLFSLYAFPH